MIYQGKLRTAFRTVALLLAVAAALCVLGLLVAGTGGLNSVLRRYAQSHLTEALGVPVQVGPLEGSPLSGIRLGRVQVGDVERPYVALDSLVIRHRLLPLLKGRVVVDTFRVHGLQAWIHPPGDRPHGDSVTVAVGLERWTRGPGWEIQVMHAEVADGKLALAVPGFRDRVEDLSLVAGLQAGPGGYRVDLRRFRSLLFEPPLTVNNVQGTVEFAGTLLTIRDLRLDTERSHLALDGTVSGLDDPEFDLDFRADPLALGDFPQAFPSFMARTSARIRGRSRGSLRSLQTEMGIRYRGAVCDLFGIVDLSSGEVAYEVRAQARDLDLRGIIPDQGVDARGDLEIQAAGRGWELPSAEAQVTVGISRGQLLGVGVDAVKLEATLREGQVEASYVITGPRCSIHGNLDTDIGVGTAAGGVVARVDRLDPSLVPGVPRAVTGMQGDIRVRRGRNGEWQGSVRLDSVTVAERVATDLEMRGAFVQGLLQLDSLSAQLPDGYGRARGKGLLELGRLWEPGLGKPAYHLDLHLEGLALDRMAGLAGPIRPVSARVRIAGRGVEPDSVEARADLVVEGPAVADARLDTVLVSLVSEGRRFEVVRLVAAGPQVRLEGEGWIVPGDSLSVRVEGLLQDPGILAGRLGVGLRGEPVSLGASATGGWTDPALELHLRADSLDVAGVPMVDLVARARWPVLTSGGMLIRAGSVEWGGHGIRNLALHAGLDGRDVVFLLVNGPEDPDRLHLRGRIGRLGGGFRLELDSLAVDVEQLALRNLGPFSAGYDPKVGLNVERLRLQGPAGRIDAQNDPEDPGVVKVVLDAVELRTWSFLLGLGQEVAGTLSGNFRVSGTHDRPALKGTCDLKGGRVSGVGFDRLSGEVDLADGQIAANLEVLQRPGRSAAVKGSLPTSLVLGGGDSPSEKPVELFLESQGLDVGFLAVLLDEVHSASGTLSARIRLNGRPGELRPEGWFRLDQGSAHIGPLNKTFAPINAHVRLAPDRIEVESLRVGSAENTLRLEGVATLSGPAVGEIHAHVRAGHFGVIDLPELTAIATADVSLGGSLEDPRVEGTVQLERAVVRLSDYLEAPPETQSVWEGSAFLRSLMGTVRVSASRNVWIRDRDLNVEISGDVDLVKTTDGIRIYGSLASRRGRYDFQNTSFDIDQGEIHFRGQAEIDPELYILATQRIMLASGEPATISAIVGGTLLYPRITLESDTTPPLSEADMLSYLVLGRPSENVIGGAQESGSGKPGIEGQAAGLVLGVAANQLKRQIGRQLNLDLVEIDMGGGGGTTRVRVGKYIGTKLFVSYAQDVSSARAQEVTVEYELLPQVTLEAQQRSGSQTQIDRKSLGVFWKLEW